MSLLINLFILLPLAGFLLSLAIPQKNEALLSRSSFLTAGIQLVSAIAFTVLWITEGYPVLEQKDMIIVETSSYQFLIAFTFDKIAATFLIVGAFLTFMVTIYS